MATADIISEQAIDVWEKATATGQILQRVTKLPKTMPGALSLPTVNETSRANGSRSGGFALAWLEDGAALIEQIVPFPPPG